MDGSSKRASSRPTWLILNYVVLLLTITSFVFYTVMYKREILNDIERMQVRGRERDEKIQKFEQRLAELEKKMWDCKRENKRVLASSILKGVLKNRHRRDATVDARYEKLARLVDRLVNTSLFLPVHLKGIPGSAGPPGKRGKPEPIGPKGLKGDQGRLGLKGSKGDRGIKGSMGQNGQKGVKGQKGDSVSVPKIKTHPRTQAVLQSDSATFTCEAIGNPEPVIQLIKLNGTMDSRYKSIGNGMLEIENVKPNDEGKISCVAKSVLGKDISSAMLTVLVPAKAVIAEKNIVAEEGYNVKVRCIVEGNPKPDVEWHRADKRLPLNIDFEDQTRTLVIRKAKLENRGRYICSAQNQLKNSTATTNFIVKKRLSFFFKSSALIQPFEYQKLTISCIYEHGVEPVVVKWFKDNKPLTREMSLTRKNQVLTINNVNMKDAGQYKCVVQSKFSRLQSVTSVALLRQKTCKDLRLAGVMKSGKYKIYPIDSKPVQVFCDMSSKSGVGVTVISHDSEARTKVDGIEAAGGYRGKITYEISKDTLKEIAKLSNKCEQFIKYECMGSFLSENYGLWKSIDGRSMFNWGGVDHTRKGCACSLTNSCAKGLCNCDKNDLVLREDSGFLQEKQFLPIAEVRFGDTGDPREYGYHTVGKFKCF